MRACKCLLAAMLVVVPALATPTEDERIEEAVVELYVRGLQTRDFELIREVCIPEAKLMGVNRAGELNVTTLEEWSKRFDPANPPFERLEHSIERVDRKGNAAQVRINFVVDGERHVTDYLQMLRIGERWLIVSIIDD